MNKKLYLEPEMEILDIEMEGALLVVSMPDNDGEVGGTTVDTETPGWDSQF